MRFPKAFAARAALVVTMAVLGSCANKGTQAPAAATAGEPAALAAAPWGSVEQVQAACRQGIDRAEALRATLKDKAAATVDGTLRPYNEMLGAIDGTSGIMSLIGNVHPEKPVREAAEACERDVLKLENDINLDRGLYEAVSGVDGAELDAHAKRFVFKVMREFRRAGVDKDEATRTKLKALHEQMVEVGQTFSRNIREDVRTIHIDSAEALAGLPDDFIKAHAPGEDGKIAITTNYPDYFPVQRYAHSEALRRKLVDTFHNRGYPANEEWLKKLLDLRKEYASALGYDDWAEYMAEDKMVKKAAVIEKFIDDVAKIARPRMERDLEVLLKRKQKDSPEAKAIELWDRFYFVDRVRAEQYGFDARTVRPYFEYGRVTAGLMALYGELFGLRFEKNDETPVWHESVTAYDMFSGDTRIARFYLDMHPRDGKYGHAAMFPLKTGLTDGPIPVGALVCNFPDPSANEDPALMEHQQVVTYFHEFGHLIHHLLARGSKWVNLSGIRVEWDFVEAPSQLLEEWAWDPAVLARFAKHIETDEPISADVVAKMRASSEFGKGVHIMRQVFYTALSYHLHATDPAKVDLLQFMKNMQARYMPYPYVDGTHTYASFGHLEGYSSMYYTYQWSLVLAKDIFTRFAKAGLLDTATAQEYREKILMPGGSVDADELVESFLGRPQNLEAYRTWLESD